MNHLTEDEYTDIIQLFIENKYLFAWAPSDMLDIEDNVIWNHLSLRPNFKIVIQRKRKVGEEKWTSIIEEFKKLKKVIFINEIKYPNW